MVREEANVLLLKNSMKKREDQGHQMKQAGRGRSLTETTGNCRATRVCWELFRGEGAGRSAYRSHRVGDWRGMAAGSYSKETPWPWLDPGPVKANTLMEGVGQRVRVKRQ